MLKSLNKIEKEDSNFVLDKCTKIFGQLEGKKIFITGATGFFGKNLLFALISINSQLTKPIEITVLTRNKKKFLQDFELASSPEINFIEADIQDPLSIKNDFDYIINAAVPSTKDLREKDPELNYQTIVKAAENIINLTKQNLKTKLLYVSSGAVYSPSPNSKLGFKETDYRPINEDLNKNNVYKLGKIKAEELHFEKLKNNFVIARAFSFAGPYLPLDQNFAFGNFLNDILNNRDIVIEADGTAVRSYLYSMDLAIWLLFMLVNGNGIYNLGSDQNHTIKELAEAMTELSESSIIINNKVQGSSKYFPNTNKAKQELGLELWHNLKQSIEKSLEWNRSKKIHAS